MRKPDLDKHKSRLLEMRKRLTLEVGQIEEAINEDAMTPGSLSHLPTHNADFDSGGVDRNITLAQNEEGLLQAVEEALERIEQGDFGACQECGEPISAARLEAVPYAATCVSCARKLETG